MTEKRLETKVLHSGYAGEPQFGARAVPIYETASFLFGTAEEAARRFSEHDINKIYTRIGNPTVAVLEQRLADMDEGLAAVCYASGMGAISTLLLALLKEGDHIVVSNTLYGGTISFFSDFLPRFGIKISYVDINKTDEIRAAVNKDTKLLYAESIGNPKLNLIDPEAVSEITKEHNIPFILDNTVTPGIFKPFKHGVDIIVYSLTKYISGHGITIGGAVVDSGSMDWRRKFSRLSIDTPPFHSAKYGNMSLIDQLKITLYQTGACMSPLTAFLILQGLETLPLRMKKIGENALKIAEFLKNHSKVSWVNYPGLKDHPQYNLTEKYFSEYGPSGLLTFGVRGGLEAGKKLINNVKLCSLLANIGDAKTLIIHPASTTHFLISEEERQETGVTDDMIRLSAGIEAVDDIIEDLSNALNSI